VVGGVSSGTGVVVRFALRHPERAAGLVLVSPIYGGAKAGLTAHQAETFRLMDAFGSRATAEGVHVLDPLYERLPSPVRERALRMVDGFDAASVAATTRFLASGAQPFDAFEELRAIDVPTLLVPGADELHPASVSEAHAASLPRCTVAANDGDVGAIGAIAAIGAFCEGL
jgi:pimeloyl-ACP methyl ester carboxylesterase